MKQFKHDLLHSEKTYSAVIFCCLLLFIGMIGSLTIDMYVPSMPDIVKSFHTTASAIKLTITLYLVSYALGQLIYGPLIDSYGRRKILLMAIVIGMLGSILCFYAPSVTVLFIGRLLQGIGYSVIAVAAMAMARDVLSELQFAQAGSILSLAFGIGPLVSPILGSYIAHFFGWRMIFEIISIYSILIILVMMFVIPETLDESKRQVLHIKVILENYKKVFSNQFFLANALSKSIAYTGFIVFYTVTPFMLQDHLGLSAIAYGWITLSLTSTTLLAKLVNAIILKYFNINRLIFLSTLTLAFASCILLLLGLLHIYNVYAIVIPFMIFGIGSGFLFANATVVAFTPFKKMSSGSVAGLLNGLQLFSAFVGSAIAAHLGIETLLPLGVFMAVISVFVVMQYIFLSRSTATNS